VNPTKKLEQKGTISKYFNSRIFCEIPAELQKIFFSAEIKRKHREEKARGDFINVY